jgi:hypothetical protein
MLNTKLPTSATTLKPNASQVQRATIAVGAGSAGDTTLELGEPERAITILRC